MVIVAAVDRTERAPRVVREAVKIAEAFDDTVHAVHVLSSSEFLKMEQTEIKKSGKAADMERIKQAARRHAEEIVSEFDSNVEAVGKVGNVSETVIDYAEDTDAQYIITGPRKKSPTGKALFGSIAQSILLRATCPVVVLSVQDGS